MYAIIRSGGKQYRVTQGDEIDVDLLSQDAGASVEFNEVLLLNNGTVAAVGEPCVPNALVRGEVIGEAAGPKTIAFKYRRRKSSRCKKGHRQKYSRVKILEIVG